LPAFFPDIVLHFWACMRKGVWVNLRRLKIKENTLAERRRFAFYLSASITVLFLATAACPSVVALALDNVHCHVIPQHEPSAAEKAYLAGNASQAEALYREALNKSPHDAGLAAGLVRSLLREESGGRRIHRRR
jgi:hypothetical protein